jgi:hypothetical protein
MHKESGLDPVTWFNRVAQTTSGHATTSIKIRVRAGWLEVLRNFFSTWVIADWNKIPTNVKAIKSAAKYKAT